MPAVVGIAWTVYGIVAAIFFLFSIGFTRYYQDKHERDTFATIVTILALGLVLSCLALLPVDIFLVSSTVDQWTGLKKPWATPDTIENMKFVVQWVYYGCYGMIGFFCFFLIPFAYFYYEEEDVDQARRDRIKGAFKYTSFFVAISIFLFLFALFLKPNRPPPKLDLDWFKHILLESNGEKTIAFVIACLALLGMLILIGYTAPGLSLFPMGLIKGKKALDVENEDVGNQLVAVRERQRALQAKYTGNNKVMTAHDYRSMENLEDEERILVRRLRGIEEDKKSVWQKIFTFLRPFELIIGILSFMLTWVIMISMFLTIVDKIASSICGRQCGYIISHPTLFNPINFIFVNLSKWFPLDYVFMIILILYYFMATLSGLVTMGIRFLWMNLYHIRKNGTAPQGLLVTAVLLTLSLLALNYTVTTTVAPGYAHFGSQVYCNYTIGDKRDCSDRNEYIIPCDLKAPTEICTPTTSSILIDRVLVDTPFLGFIFYWCQWAFLGMFLIGSVVAIFWRPRNNVGSGDDDYLDDEEQQGLLSSGSQQQQQQPSYH
ncbi:uncharacterized protein BX664DRAFT_329013 [Halteromyces radiatus]|uniref:uncharacterized protein n=1 Tax=Halteromyces radiatus TaxID=101107 RepID=UPI00221E9BA8|nr:uncharacterized protein BX664DRAFT_329013 [Halteromyces radiatus]KAI8093137.1 hypothetical protein BX664DRAFT_329013 [Halteromyces radiatus]